MQRGPDCYTGSYATAVLSASARSPVAKAPTNRPAPPPFSSIIARRRRWLAATSAVGVVKLTAVPRLVGTDLTPSSRATRRPEIEVSATRARHSRVNALED